VQNARKKVDKKYIENEHVMDNIFEKLVTNLGSIDSDLLTNRDDVNENGMNGIFTLLLDSDCRNKVSRYENKTSSLPPQPSLRRHSTIAKCE
jgi:hypothetical protein